MSSVSIAQLCGNHIDTLLQRTPRRIQEGDRVPDTEFIYADTSNHLTTHLLRAEIQDCHALIVTIPNATLLKQHADYVKEYEQFEKLGVAKIIFVATDKFIHMLNYKKKIDPENKLANKLLIVADPLSTFAIELGVGIDKRKHGAAIEAIRSALYVEKGVVRFACFDEGKQLVNTKASNVLQRIKGLVPKNKIETQEEAVDASPDVPLASSQKSLSKINTPQDVDPSMYCNHAQTPEEKE
jgi:peroxiredoxin